MEEVGKTEQELIAYYATLDYEQQRRLLVALVEHNKKPPYYIAFKLDSTGINNLAKVAEYCTSRGIKYTAEKAGEAKVRFRFEGMGERNAVLLGRLTI